MYEARNTSHTVANVLITCAVVAWMISALVAALDWHGAVSGRAAALGAVAAAITGVAIVVNTRQAEGKVVLTVARAPRDQYYRGYGDCAEDAFGGPDL